MPFLSSGLDPVALSEQTGSPAGIIGSILSGFASMLFSAIIAAIYIELRFVKDGVSVDQLAAVFE